MSPYILIAWFWVSGYGGMTSEQVRFPSLEACRAAQAEIMRMSPDKWPGARVVCVKAD
jgi:hypothetical protein